MELIFKESKVVTEWNHRWACHSQEVIEEKLKIQSNVESHFHEELGILFVACYVEANHPDFSERQEVLERCYYKPEAIRRTIKLYDEFCEHVLRTMPPEDTRPNEEILAEYAKRLKEQGPF